ncbi:hypothetical protein AB0M29_24980 [Streptomyces sp. NPDC051976]|uniref:hypothetical protein n=1 Tax=Streptomyces sp. NPDC051976 TaxID=3154947 RepID=UPI0034461F57
MRNRLALPLFVLTLVALVLLAAAGPADAHGDSITFRIDGQQAGHVRTVATWANDGDPVTEKLAATLSAVSKDGNTLGPWILVPVPGAPATFTTHEALPAGTWKIHVEAGYPALGLGTGTVTVGQGPIADPTNAFPSQTPTPTGVRTTPGATGATSAPTAKAAADTHSAASTDDTDTTSSVRTTWIAAASGIILAAAVAAGVTIVRRRRRSPRSS